MLVLRKLITFFSWFNFDFLLLIPTYKTDDEREKSQICPYLNSLLVYPKPKVWSVYAQRGFQIYRVSLKQHPPINNATIEAA